MEQVLYKLPDGWEWHSVKKLSHNIQYGHTAKAESNGNAKFLRITDIQDGKIDWQGVPTVSLEEKEISKYALNDDDLIFARSGATAGKSILIKNAPKDAVFASYLIRIVPNKKDIIPEYLSYFFLTPAYWEVVGQNAAGAAQPNINGTKLSEFIVPVAPQGEQKRIVEKLDALLTRIDTAIEHLQESVVLADALYASELNEIFNPSSSPINQIGIYELPDRWEWKQLSDVVDKTENLNPLKNADQLWTYIDISSVDRARFTITDPKKFLGKDAPSRAKKHVQLNDVIFATTRPNLKNIALVRDEYNSPVASTGFCVLRANEKVLPAYLFYFVTTDFIQAQIEPYVGGASYPAITDGNLKKAPIPIPSIEEQKSIVKKINNIEKLQVALKEQLQLKISSLEQLKASILDYAFKGKL